MKQNDIKKAFKLNKTKLIILIILTLIYLIIWYGEFKTYEIGCIYLKCINCCNPNLSFLNLMKFTISHIIEFVLWFAVFLLASYFLLTLLHYMILKIKIVTTKN